MAGHSDLTVTHFVSGVLISSSHLPSHWCVLTTEGEKSKSMADSLSYCSLAFFPGSRYDDTSTLC